MPYQVNYKKHYNGYAHASLFYFEIRDRDNLLSTSRLYSTMKECVIDAGQTLLWIISEQEV